MATEPSDACMLSEGEEIIFDDGNLGNNEKLVLTNRRLIFLQSKGWINKTYEKKDEIPIQDIESAHSDPKQRSIVLQYKNGEKDLIGFAVSTGAEDWIMGTQPDTLFIRLQSTIDRWVSQINTLASGTRKLPDMIYCKYCNAKNKSANMKCEHCGALMS
jgi:hypothetical protein